TSTRPSSAASPATVRACTNASSACESEGMAVSPQSNCTASITARVLPAPSRNRAGTLRRVARRILWASLALAPATILVHYLLHPGDTADFILSAVALPPRPRPR